MTLQNAFYTNKTPPLIKMTSFTTLDEVDVAKMRSFLSINDPRILPGEVFFYTPNSLNREFEGDFWPTLHQISAATQALTTARRLKYEQQQPNGSTVTVAPQLKVLWMNPSASPAHFVQVSITLK